MEWQSPNVYQNIFMNIHQFPLSIYGVAQLAIDVPEHIYEYSLILIIHIWSGNALAKIATSLPEEFQEYS